MTATGELIVDVDGFEGPLGLLLDLARDHKIDLRRISILALVDQYLAFIERAERLRIELAADYLLMAAWLAFLKSRLLLPEPPADEPDPSEAAEALAFRLRRLEAMREAGDALFRRPLLGRDLFARGAPEGFQTIRREHYEATLYDLLTAYAASQLRGAPTVIRIRAPEYYSVDDALQRLQAMIGTVVEWRQLVAFLPPLARAGLAESPTAATFAAALELARSGRIELRQDEAFGPIWLRAARPHR